FHVVVQVIAGRKASGADVADHLPLLDGDAFLDAGSDLDQMAVGSDAVADVLETHSAPQTTHPAGFRHPAVRHGANRRAPWRGQVDSHVRAPAVQDGMIAAHRELGADLPELERVTEEVTRHRATVGAIVAARPVLRLEQHRDELHTARPDLGAENLAWGRLRLPGLPEVLVD